MELEYNTTNKFIKPNELLRGKKLGKLLNTKMDIQQVNNKYIFFTAYK
jgi:hypothetical protein